MALSAHLRRGISLVEILVALVFLVFGLAGVTDLYVTQMQQAARVRQQQSVSAAAFSALTILQSAGFAALDGKLAVLPKASPSENDVALFSQPIPSADKNIVWNAHLKKELQPDGSSRIRVAVQASWLAAAVPGKSIQKEVVGYVAAP
jgi:type II secretory pathway pseudopilin PulG